MTPSTSVRVRRIRADDWQRLREIRLRALSDSPSAFGSTYGETRLRPEKYWRDRAATTATSDTDALFAAVAGEDWVGLAGGCIDPEQPDVVELISLWVDPSHRRMGLAAALCRAVEAWAQGCGASRAQLWVTETNEAAMRLYQRLGYANTGLRQPVRPGESAMEILMARVL